MQFLIRQDKGQWFVNDEPLLAENIDEATAMLTDRLLRFESYAGMSAEWARAITDMVEAGFSISLDFDS